ncbi:phosphotransferase [Alphaproteobacteria bacterium]|nr:phosphotransferase [Alphaproteobacteria bacterium]
MTCSIERDSPKNHAMTKLLEKTFGTSQAADQKALLGGKSSPCIKKVTIHGKHYVLRYINARRSLKDRQRELHASQLSATRGISPNIVGADVANGLVIMDYVDDEGASRAAVMKLDKGIEQFARDIRKIHDGPAFKPLLSSKTHKPTTVFSIPALFAERLKSEPPEILQKALKKVEQLQRELKDKLIQRPCHNDLQPRNILFSKNRFVFIDWEAASQDDPFFDLATVTLFYKFHDDLEMRFLTSYFGRTPEKADIKKLHGMQKLVAAYYGAAFLFVSQSMKVLEPLTDCEIEQLPSFKDFFRHGKEKFNTPESTQRLSYVLLKEALKD